MYGTHPPRSTGERRLSASSRARRQHPRRVYERPAESRVAAATTATAATAAAAATAATGRLRGWPRAPCSARATGGEYNASATALAPRWHAPARLRHTRRERRACIRNDETGRRYALAKEHAREIPCGEPASAVRETRGSNGKG